MTIPYSIETTFKTKNAEVFNLGEYRETIDIEDYSKAGYSVIMLHADSEQEAYEDCLYMMTSKTVKQELIDSGLKLSTVNKNRGSNGVECLVIVREKLEDYWCLGENVVAEINRVPYQKNKTQEHVM